jgi:transposase
LWTPDQISHPENRNEWSVKQVKRPENVSFHSNLNREENNTFECDYFEETLSQVENKIWHWYLKIVICYKSLLLSMNCPRCKSTSHKKNGKTGGRQRYKCHDCGYNYSVEIKSTASPMSVKRQALQLYLEGLGFRSIGRFLGVSHVSVQKWIRKFGSELEDLKSENEISIVELDEMHTYIGNKKTTAGSGLLLIEMGKNSSTALLAAEELKQD